MLVAQHRQRARQPPPRRVRYGHVIECAALGGDFRLEPFFLADLLLGRFLFCGRLFRRLPGRLLGRLLGRFFLGGFLGGLLGRRLRDGLRMVDRDALDDFSLEQNVGLVVLVARGRPRIARRLVDHDRAA